MKSARKGLARSVPAGVRGSAPATSQIDANRPMRVAVLEFGIVLFKMSSDLKTWRETEVDPRVEEVCRALQLQPLQSIAALADLVELRPSRLRDIFKDQTGVCISKYSLEVRLQKARSLIADTYLSMKQIRNEVGIPDASNFVRYFKNRFQMTPSSYRKAVRRPLDQQIGV